MGAGIDEFGPEVETVEPAGQGLVGSAFVEHYANSRIRERRQFKRAITGRELERHFEIF
jgi:hypothetical protein